MMYLLPGGLSMSKGSSRLKKTQIELVFIKIFEFNNLNVGSDKRRLTWLCDVR